MNHNDDREDHPTEPAPASAEPIRPPPQDFGKTGPLPAVSAGEVLGVFSLFQEQILERIDARDKTILDAIKKIGSDVFAQYERIAKRGDENHKWIGALRKRTHEHSTQIQQLMLRVHDLETRSGMEPILPPPEANPLEVEIEDEELTT